MKFSACSKLAKSEKVLSQICLLCAMSSNPWSFGIIFPIVMFYCNIVCMYILQHGRTVLAECKSHVVKSINYSYPIVCIYSDVSSNTGIQQSATHYICTYSSAQCLTLQCWPQCIRIHYNYVVKSIPWIKAYKLIWLSTLLTIHDFTYYIISTRGGN